MDETSRLDYGSKLRDSAGVLALAAETSVASVIPAVAQKVETARGSRIRFSTQENAWLLRASQALKAEGAKLALTVNGTAQPGIYNRTLDEAALADAIKVGNASTIPVNATVTLTGAPKAMPAGGVAGPHHRAQILHARRRRGRSRDGRAEHASRRDAFG